MDDRRGKDVAVSVIIPAYNAADTIGRTLAALAAQDTDMSYEVIVVDDGSDDETVSIVRAADPPVAIYEQDHLGPGPARNLGVANARGAALAFTDADCFPTEPWLTEGLKALERADLVQGAVLPDPESDRGPLDRTIWVTQESGLWETANLFIGRALFDQLGGFEDWLPARIGKPLAEDVWLGWRARRAGATTLFSESALVYHAVFPRGPRGYVWERARLMYFPAMARKMPEIRETFCYRRWFLSRHTAEFDLAVLGAFALLALRNPLPLAGAIPYGRFVAGRRRRCGNLVAASDVAGDTLGLTALLWGSLRSRSLVI